MTLLREIFAEMFVVDPPAAVDYYCRLFDLSVHRRDGSFSELRGQGLRLNICGLDSLPAPLASRSAEANHLVGSRVELCFEVSDLEEVFRRAVAMNAIVAEPITARPWARVDFRLIGPEGAYLRITTPESGRRTDLPGRLPSGADRPSSGPPDDRFTALHRLRILGRAEPERLAEATGLRRELVGRLLEDLRREGLAQRREGRLGGWALTSAGREEHHQRLASDLGGAGAAEAVDAEYGHFTVLDVELKAICTAWQLRDAATLALNDHTDRAYDGAVLARLRRLHHQIGPLIDRLAQSSARFAIYSPRLTGSYRRIFAGEIDFLTKPLTGSYHDVWMELHEDLLLTLGRRRGTDTAGGT